MHMYVYVYIDGYMHIQSLSLCMWYSHVHTIRGGGVSSLRLPVLREREAASEHRCGGTELLQGGEGSLHWRD